MSNFVAILGLFAIVGIVEPHQDGGIEPGFVIPFENVLKEFSEILQVSALNEFQKCLTKYKEMYINDYVLICVKQAEGSLIRDSEKDLLKKTRKEKIKAIDALIEYLNATEPICIDKYVPFGKYARQSLIKLKEKQDEVYVEGEEPLFRFRVGKANNGA